MPWISNNTATVRPTRSGPKILYNTSLISLQYFDFFFLNRKGLGVFGICHLRIELRCELCDEVRFFFPFCFNMYILSTLHTRKKGCGNNFYTDLRQFFCLVILLWYYFVWIRVQEQNHLWRNCHIVQVAQLNSLPTVRVAIEVDI